MDDSRTPHERKGQLDLNVRQTWQGLRGMVSDEPNQYETLQTATAAHMQFPQEECNAKV
jgi:hypothetical protein